VPGEDAGVGVEVHRPLAFVQRHPQTAADVDLPQRAACVHEPAHQARALAEGLVEDRQLVVQHPVRQVEVRRVDGEAVSRGARHGLLEVAFRDVRAGVGDLLGQESALQAVEHLARRAGVQPDRRRVAGRAEPAQHVQGRRCAEGLEREPDAMA